MTTTTFVDEVTVIEASWLNDVNADVYGVRPVATGGTGATDAADARTNLGLGNVDNTSDANKPVSTAQQAALNLKANLVSPSFTTPSLGVATATSLQGIIGNITPAAGTFTTLTSTGNAALGDAEATDTHAIKGATTLLANSASAALTVTQTGAGNAFVVEDSASTDADPFIIDASGNVGVGVVPGANALRIRRTGASNTVSMLEAEVGVNYVVQARYATDVYGSSHQFRKYRGSIGAGAVVVNGDQIGATDYFGFDGTQLIQAAQVSAAVDGTPGTNDMPGRLVFSTTADGATSPTERMRIDSAGLTTVTGTLKVSTGAAVGGATPGTGGIAFPATAVAVADANTLDDYEEGTFTPTIAFGGAAVGLTYGAQAGSYTKIGNTVRVNLTIQLSAKGSSTGAAVVSGLPFTASASYQFFGTGALTGATAGVGDAMLNFRFNAGAATCNLYKMAAGVLTQLTDADFTAATIIYMSAIYII